MIEVGSRPTIEREPETSSSRIRKEFLPYWASVLAFAIAVAVGLPVVLVVTAILNVYALARTFGSTGRSALAPSLLFSLIITAFGFLGFVATGPLERSGYIPSYLHVADSARRTDTFELFLLASLFVLIGAAFTRGRGSGSRGQLGELSALSSLLRNPSLALGFGFATLVFNLSVRPIDQVLDRQSYLIPTDFGGILTYLQIPAAVLLGLAIRPSSWPARFAATTLFLLLETFSFALSSRMMSLVALMFFTGVAFGYRRAKPFLLICGLIIALILVPVPLYMRGLSEQGLYPNLRALPNVQFFSYEAYIATFSNLISCFNVVALTAFRAGPIPWSAFLDAIDPLPGALFGQSNGPALRLTSAVPFAGLGEIANHGVWLVPIFFFLIGCTFGLAEAATSKILRSGRNIYLSVAPTGVAFLAAILFSQYNLKTASRMIYLNIALTFIMAALGARNRSSDTSPPRR